MTSNLVREVTVQTESPGVPAASPEAGPPAEGSIYPVVPSSAIQPTFRQHTSLTPLVCDERAIAKLLETLISRSGKSLGVLSDSLGVTRNAVRQYIRGRRNKPSLIWFVRLAEACGARVSIEFPKR